MPDNCYINCVFVIVNPIYDTIISYPKPPQIFCAAKLLAADWAEH
jgi:hypothetical protein